MRSLLKVGIIIEAVVLVVAIAFSIFYFENGFYRVNHGYDVLLVMLWVLVAAALLFLFWSRSLAREEMMRRFYLSPEWIYNHEIGFAPIADTVESGNLYDFVAFAADSLAKMSYGFEVAESPEDFKAQYVVSSRRFKFHHTDDDGVVIDEWRGVLQKVNRAGGGDDFTLEDIGGFSDINHLVRLLEDEEVFA